MLSPGSSRHFRSFLSDHNYVAIAYLWAFHRNFLRILQDKHIQVLNLLLYIDHHSDTGWGHMDWPYLHSDKISVKSDSIDENKRSLKLSLIIKVILFFNQILNYFAVFSPVCSIPFVDRVLTKLHPLII